MLCGIVYVSIQSQMESVNEQIEESHDLIKKLEQEIDELAKRDK